MFLLILIVAIMCILFFVPPLVDLYRALTGKTTFLDDPIFMPYKLYTILLIIGLIFIVIYMQF